MDEILNFVLLKMIDTGKLQLRRMINREVEIT